jgi:5-methyltetrahydrofolate--homocysteine methyltransferase
MSESQVFNRLKKLVISLDKEGVEKATQDALAQGFSPQDIISKGLSKGMAEVGERFERREFFLPELLFSATAMKSALSVLQPYFIKAGGKVAGKIVLGVAQGDPHDIGKNIVGAVLQSDGFEVYDLGMNVPAEEFVKKAQEVKADIVGISAFLSSCFSKLAETVILLKENNVPAKILIGGAAATQESVEEIGADAYGKDAWEGLLKARQLVKGGS